MPAEEHPGGCHVDFQLHTINTHHVYINEVILYTMCIDSIGIRYEISFTIENP